MGGAGQGGGGAAGIARETAATPGATVEDVLWRVWSASGLAERWSTQRDGPAARRPGPGRGGGAVRRGGPVHRPVARCADRGLPRPPRRAGAARRLPGRRPPTGARRCGCSPPTRPRGWSGTWSRCRGTGGGVARPAAAGQPARRRAAGRPARGSRRGAGRSDRPPCWTRSVDCSMWRSPGRVRHLLVSAVAPASVGEADGEAQPSRFLAELTGETGEPVVGPEVPARRWRRALTLPALVAELRTVVADRAEPLSRRRAAAAALARLAAAGVSGARPRPVVGVGAVVGRPAAGRRRASRCGSPPRHRVGAAVQPALVAGASRRGAAGDRGGGDGQPGARGGDAGRRRGGGSGCAPQVALGAVRRDRARGGVAGRAGAGAGGVYGGQAGPLAGEQPAPADRDRARVRGPARRRRAWSRPGRPVGGRRGRAGWWWST